MEMLHINKADFDRIGADYKGVYMDYQGVFPKRKGRRVAFLPGHGTTLYTEGIHFIVDGDYSHLPILCKENAEEGAAYQFGGDVLYVKRIYRISREYARETILHIWSAWKPASATLRCLTATQSTRRGLTPPAGGGVT